MLSARLSQSGAKLVALIVLGNNCRFHSAVQARHQPAYCVQSNVPSDSAMS
jgi:hypothetical protein